MRDEVQKRIRRANVWLAVICGVSVLIFPLIWVLSNTAFAEEFDALGLNEKGDAIGGFSSPLAFLAAAIAIFLQSRELSAQREELRLTRREFEAQRLATEEMARSMAAQAVIFEDEKARRDEANADSTVNTLISPLDLKLRSEEFTKVSWNASKKIDGLNISNRTLSIPKTSRYVDSITIQLVPVVADLIFDVNQRIKRSRSEGWNFSINLNWTSFLDDVEDLARKIEDMRQVTSAAKRIEIDQMRLSHLVSVIEEIRREPYYLEVFAGLDVE